MNRLNQRWDDAIEQIRQDVSNNTFESFIEPLQPIRYDQKKKILYIACDNELVLKRFKERYFQLVERAIATAFQDDIKVEASLSVPSDTEKPKKTGKSNEILSAASTDLFSEEYYLNPRFNFETFVVGKNNEFAYSAAKAVAKAPATQYNPLFLYGGSGLGKTHLMHAIGHYILNNNKNKKVLYVSSETFTNELISALRHNKIAQFKNKYRKIDILMIDDIQFIEGKESTQEEFFYTFEALYNKSKQIIISSDRSPQKLQGLDDRLRSRFMWSVTADIQPPDFETRVAILKNKAINNNISITPDVEAVIMLIAERIKTNIREMEGALIRIMSFSTLLGKPITPQFAKETLQDLFGEEASNVTVDTIKRQVCKYYNISLKDMDSSRRSRVYSYPRQIAMYLSKELTDLSLPKIGASFGGRDHTTVLYAYDKIKGELTTNEELKKQIQEIKDRF